MGLPKSLLAKGVTDMVRISDGRMSGTGFGTVILHASPEAAMGGNFAMVDGAVRMETGPVAEGTGATLTWKGPKVGSGSVAVTSEDRDKGLWFDLRLGRQPIHGVLQYEAQGPGTTTVKLTLRGDAGNDIPGRYVGWFRSRSIGRDASEALTRLARRAEAGG